MKKSRVIILILGIILLIVPFLINVYSIYRIISLALGIFLIVLSLSSYHNIFITIILPIVLIFSSYGIDTLLFSKLERIPIYSYEVVSSDTVSTYNSFFYRIYNCDGENIIDYNYELDYACSIDSLDKIDVNTFLKDPLNSFDTYRHKFIRLSGKISKTSGIDSISLALYEIDDESLNGYVNFNLNYVVKANTSVDLSNYRIYDNIEVIGLVSSITEDDGTYTITLEDTVLIPSSIYEEYTYDITSNSDNTLSNITGNYYFYNISTFNVIYDSENIYELSYLITDNRFTIDTLIKNTSGITLSDEEEVDVATYYEMDEYNVMVCLNDRYIISTDNLDYSVCYSE